MSDIPQLRSSLYGGLLKPDDNSQLYGYRNGVPEVVDTNIPITLLVDYTGQVTGYNISTIPVGWRANQGDVGVVIGNNVTSIGSYAFYSCTALGGKLVIPPSVTSIGDYAFAQCSALSGELFLGSQIVSMGAYAFEGCYGLSRLNVNIPTIPYMCFAHCEGLTSINIGNKVNTIEGNCFMGNNALMDISLPANIIFIGSAAFGYCAALSGANIYVPSNIVNDYAIFAESPIKIVHARFDDNTWNPGPGQTIGGAPDVFVIKDL